MVHDWLHPCVRRQDRTDNRGRREWSSFEECLGVGSFVRSPFCLLLSLSLSLSLLCRGTRVISSRSSDCGPCLTSSFQAGNIISTGRKNILQDHSHFLPRLSSSNVTSVESVSASSGSKLYRQGRVIYFLGQRLRDTCAGGQTEPGA